MHKMINAKNARNFVIREILFIMINRNAINARNGKIYHIYCMRNCKKYSHFVKNVRNAICEKCEKCEKFCDMRNPIYCD